MPASGRAVHCLKVSLRNIPPFLALLRSVECRLLSEEEPFDGPVLDVGCGDGHFASLICRDGMWIGMDSSPGSVAEAAARRIYRSLLLADAVALPFQSRTFRTVIANCSLEHVRELDHALREIHRVLGAGGDFLLTVPSHRFPEMLLGSTLLKVLRLRGAAESYGNWFNQRSRHYHLFSAEGWCAKLAAHGFFTRRSRYYFTPAAHRVFDLAHYLSLPHLLYHKVTGRWVGFPLSVLNPLFERWFQPYVLDNPSVEGPYVFIHARCEG